MKIVFIENREIAKSVNEQLYGSTLEAENAAGEGWGALSLERVDMPAVKSAMIFAHAELGLGHVAYDHMNPVIEGEVCRIPMPRDRDYCGDNPRIYVRCLSAYNNGEYHGLWIDAAQDAEDIKKDIEWMLSYSPLIGTDACEEWAIHDYDGFFDINIDEYEDLERVSTLGVGICNIKETGNEAAYEVWTAFADEPEDFERFADEFIGVYKNAGEYVEEMWEESGVVQKLNEIPAPLLEGYVSQYIDYDCLASELEYAGRIHVKQVGWEECYVFTTG